MRKYRPGFTLVELMIVVGCFMLIIGPALRVFQFGTRSSLSGMKRIDTTLEARRILRQVHIDLKGSCFVWQGPGNYSFDDILYVDRSKEPCAEFLLYRFPSIDPVEKCVTGLKDDAGPARRLTSLVTYRITPAHELVREEAFHPSHPAYSRFPQGKWTQVLTKRLNYFDISPVQVPNATGPDQWFFWVSLQLRDAYQKPDLSQAALRYDFKEAPGVIISEFFDILYPEFFTAFHNNEGMNRNWHTDME